MLAEAGFEGAEADDAGGGEEGAAMFIVRPVY